jgi:hypothetical protein
MARLQMRPFDHVKKANGGSVSMAGAQARHAAKLWRCAENFVGEKQ